MTGYLHVPSMVPILAPDGKISLSWQQHFIKEANLLNQGVPGPKNLPSGVQVPQSVTVPVAKLTGGGANGSLTFTNGILTAYQAPT